jgi:uncharacterized protein YkvS
MAGVLNKLKEKIEMDVEKKIGPILAEMKAVKGELEKVNGNLEKIIEILQKGR